MVFPFLEAVLRRVCNQFVDFEGRVKTRFTVPNKNGGNLVYDPNGGRKRCNSIRDLLYLHQAEAAPDFTERINALRTHFMELVPSKDPFDLIQKWRNQSLHGATNFHTIGGSVLNLALLIVLSELKNRFEEHRQVVLQHCIQNAQFMDFSMSQFGRRDLHPHSYYPPF